jgi:hypothetical protein
MLQGIRRWGWVVLLGLPLFACDESRVDLSSFPESVGAPTRQLIVALQNAGARAEVVETTPAADSLFGAPTTHITVNGGEVYVYEFASAAETEAAVRRLPQILAVTLFPVGPHFYRGDRMIVLYVGTDPATLALFERLLGPEIA